MAQQIIYIFLDEGGNLDFRPEGSTYFSLSCITTQRPFIIHTALDTYKYNLIEYGLNSEFFHCAYDNSHVRRKMFEIIQQHLESIKIDSIIVEKCKTGPALREDKAFYPTMLGYLLRYVIEQYDRKQLNEVVVITDSLPINKKRKAVEKSVKQTLADMLPSDTPYRVLHHTCKSHYGLQIADYCNWAVFRKWEREDMEHYNKIKPAIRSEFDIFRNGMRRYY